MTTLEWLDPVGCWGQLKWCHTPSKFVIYYTMGPRFALALCMLESQIGFASVTLKKKNGFASVTVRNGNWFCKCHSEEWKLVLQVSQWGIKIGFASVTLTERNGNWFCKCYTRKGKEIVCFFYAQSLKAVTSGWGDIEWLRTLSVSHSLPGQPIPWYSFPASPASPWWSRTFPLTSTSWSPRHSRSTSWRGGSPTLAGRSVHLPISTPQCLLARSGSYFLFSILSHFIRVIMRVWGLKMNARGS